MGRTRFAPQLQPDLTEAETHAAQALHMKRTTEADQALTEVLAEAFRESHRRDDVKVSCAAIHRHSQVQAP
jgi:hypothetical protein